MNDPKQEPQQYKQRARQENYQFNLVQFENINSNTVSKNYINFIDPYIYITLNNIGRTISKSIERAMISTIYQL